jgi:hypothetical protein
VDALQALLGPVGEAMMAVGNKCNGRACRIFMLPAASLGASKKIDSRVQSAYIEVASKIRQAPASLSAY